MTQNIILTQETINAASYKELQAFAKANGMQSSGKGITAEFLRNQLLNLIATKEHAEEPISDNSIPVGDLDITRDNAPAEEIPAATEETVPADNTQKDSNTSAKKKVELPVLIQEKGESRWVKEEFGCLTINPLKDKHLKQVLVLILEGNEKYGPATFVYGKSQDENVKGRKFIETHKFAAIVQAVINSVQSGEYVNPKTGKDYPPTVSLVTTYFKQKGLIITARMSGRTKYIVTNKMALVLENLRQVCNTEAAAE